MDKYLKRSSTVRGKSVEEETYRDLFLTGSSSDALLFTVMPIVLYGGRVLR